MRKAADGSDGLCSDFDLVLTRRALSEKREA
jgi:hypothetical protein